MKLSRFLELLQKDWVMIIADKIEEKGKQLGHKIKMKIHTPTASEMLKQYTKPKRNLNPFRRKNRLSY